MCPCEITTVECTVRDCKILLQMEGDCNVKIDIEEMSINGILPSILFLEVHLLPPPPGYLGHSAHTPGSFSMSYTKNVFQNNSYESVYGLARLHTTCITIN